MRSLEEYIDIVRKFNKLYWTSEEGLSTQYAQRLGYNIERVILTEAARLRIKHEESRRPSNGEIRVPKYNEEYVNSQIRILTEDDKF